MRNALDKTADWSARDFAPCVGALREIRPVAQRLARRANDLANERRLVAEYDAVRLALPAKAPGEFAQRVVVGMFDVRGGTVDYAHRCDRAMPDNNLYR